MTVSPEAAAQALSRTDYTALLLGDLLVLGAMAAFILFALVYSYLVAWETAPFGRYLMQSAIALILVLSLPSNFVILEATYPLYGWFRVGVLMFLLYVAVRYVRLLLRLQKAGRVSSPVSSGGEASPVDVTNSGGNDG